jgi:hypothetical protein
MPMPLARTAGQRSELLGTMQHFLGVPPQQLRQAFLPSRKAAQVSSCAVQFVQCSAVCAVQCIL